MSDRPTVTSHGIGFFGLLTLLLIALKLTHTIDLSWWWIVACFFAPLIILLTFAVLTVVVTGVFIALALLVRMFRRRP